uniref:Tensin 4 n=1 Tax=Myotis myotis TaxID=51298 RepID=A0A7J7T9X5_MYOMY|nr:tensin 4 [Myotis myotis]
MSQVMPSPLLAGGHAVLLPPCEEPRRALHPAPSPNLPPQYPYYTTEGWGAQALMASTPCKEPPNRLQQAPQAGAKASCLLRSPGEQPSGALEDSYIGFSLESLNQMILELDPTFQLLPTGSGGPWAEPTQSTTSQRKKEEPEALGLRLAPAPGQVPALG